MRTLGVWTSSVLLMVTSACSQLGIGDSEFACVGKPQGVSCKSTREVYELTNSRDHVSGKELADEARARAAEGERRPAPRVVESPVDGFEPAPVARTDGGRVAIRTPSVVIRVYVAPYTDQAGDLHMAGLVYSEVEPRKWQVGGSDDTADNQRLMRPLDAEPARAVNPSDTRVGGEPRKPKNDETKGKSK